MMALDPEENRQPPLPRRGRRCEESAAPRFADSLQATTNPVKEAHDVPAARRDSAGSHVAILCGYHDSGRDTRP